MIWKIKYWHTFTTWWDRLNEFERKDIDTVIKLLEYFGVNLPYPYSSKIHVSKYSHMRELRIQHKGKPYRILYAFDPQRNAVLLIGDNKTGDDRWYKKFVPLADELYGEYLTWLEEEKNYEYFQ